MQLSFSNICIKTKYPVLVFYFRDNPEKIFECFFEVAAPEDDKSGKISIQK